MTIIKATETMIGMKTMRNIMSKMGIMVAALKILAMVKEEVEDSQVQTTETMNMEPMTTETRMKMIGNPKIIMNQEDTRAIIFYKRPISHISMRMICLPALSFVLEHKGNIPFSHRSKILSCTRLAIVASFAVS